MKHWKKLLAVTLAAALTLSCAALASETAEETIEEITEETAEDTAEETTEEITEEITEVTEIYRSGFWDVPNESYCADAVAWAVSEGITNGVGNGFAPDQTCTVAEILTMLHRAEGSPAAGISCPYSNITTADYFYQSALWAYEKEFYYGNTFLGYEEPCSRSLAVRYLWVLARGLVAEGGYAAFSDVPSTASYAPAVAWAVRRGITTGTADGTFAPDATCTRGEIVTFLYRYYHG